MKTTKCAYALLVIAMLFFISPVTKATDVAPDDTEPTYNSALNPFIERMFELPGYTALQNNEVDVTDKFLTAMEEEYQNKNYKAIVDYMFENHISVYGVPNSLEDTPSFYAGGGKTMHQEGLIYVQNLTGYHADNQIYWQLDSFVTYYNNKITGVSAPEMKYAFAYEYPNLESTSTFEPDSSATGYSYTATKADYWFGVDAYVHYDTSLSPLPYDYHFRADGTTSFTISDIIG